MVDVTGLGLRLTRLRPGVFFRVNVRQAAMAFGQNLVERIGHEFAFAVLDPVQVAVIDAFALGKVQQALRALFPFDESRQSNSQWFLHSTAL